MDRHHWDARYAEHGLVWRAGPNEFVAAELSNLQPGRAVNLGAGERTAWDALLRVTRR